MTGNGEELTPVSRVVARPAMKDDMGRYLSLWLPIGWSLGCTQAIE
jgi:hypothetical protein